MEDVESDWGYWLGRGDDAPTLPDEGGPRREERGPRPARPRRYEELLRV